VSIVGNTTAAGVAILASFGIVFHDEIIPPPPEPQCPALNCYTLTEAGEYSAPVLLGFRFVPSYPVAIVEPSPKPF